MANITPNEFTLASVVADFEVLQLNRFEMGDSLHETFRYIVPEELRIDVAFGFPTFENAPLFEPVSFTVETRFGEPWFKLSPRIEPTGFTVEARFGEPFFTGSVVSPVVGNIRPAPPGPMSSGTTWSADISGDVAELLVWVAYAHINVVEVVYDGTDFTPNFKPQSQLLESDNLKRLSVKRAGGWPDAPIMTVRARTAQGGVNQ